LGAVEESKKDSDKDTTEAKPPVLKGKWKSVGAVYGQVKTYAGNSMTLIVEYQDIQQNPKANNPVANTAAQRQMQNLQNQLNAAQRIKNPAQRVAKIQQIMAQMQAAGMKQAMAQNNNFKMVTKKKDVDVQMSSELQVRVKDPPQEYDEKGKAKK